MAEVTNTTAIVLSPRVPPSCDAVSSSPNIIMHPILNNNATTTTSFQDLYHHHHTMTPSLSTNQSNSSTRLLPNELATPTDHPPSDSIIDLTDDHDNVIDLTSTPRRQFPVHNNQQRTSCRYANLCSPEVIFIESVKSNKSKRSPKLKEYRSIPYSAQDDSNNTSAIIKCPICLETSSQFVKNGSQIVSTVCGHIFCSHCLRHSITTMHKCPTCRKKLSLKQYHKIFL